MIPIFVTGQPPDRNGIGPVARFFGRAVSGALTFKSRSVLFSL
jgi:hypothetical protein